MWAIVGSWGTEKSAGCLSVLQLTNDGILCPIGSTNREINAGYLTYDNKTQTIYSVDERKTDGRGPIQPPAALHAFTFDKTTGKLSWKDSIRAPGSLPNYVDFDCKHRRLVSSCHASFDHIETVFMNSDGKWSSRFVFDDSTVAVIKLSDNGHFDSITDVKVFEGNGLDPNTHPQLSGHAQASPHAHCSKLDPTGKYLAVADKGTDQLYIFHMGDELKIASITQFPAVSGPRHVAFTSDGRRILVTEELSSSLSMFSFDSITAETILLDRQPSTFTECHRLNEPAELRVHPNDRFVYVNNRGEDSLTWFSLTHDNCLQLQGKVDVGYSEEPKDGARNMMFDPSGKFLLLPDLASNCLIVYAVDPNTGKPEEIDRAPVIRPAFVLVVDED